MPPVGQISAARQLPGSLLPSAALAMMALLAGSASAASLASPVTLTSEQDHERTMQLLHITELRRGPDGDPAPRGPAADAAPLVTADHLDVAKGVKG